MAATKLVVLLSVLLTAIMQVAIFFQCTSYFGIRSSDTGETTGYGSKLYQSHVTFRESMKQVHKMMAESMHRFDRKLNLPLMVLTAEEQNKQFRITEARKWLKTQKLVVGASVRNAMKGLDVSVNDIRQLTNLFHSVTAVFVENDSSDDTRKYLFSLTKQNSENFTIYLLGCGTVNSPNPCSIDISYRTGRKHITGNKEATGRTLEEESVDRGLVMAAVRNIYMNFIYSKLSADLLLVLESDLPWVPWSIDSVAQGLYYFKAKPRLDSLCALTYYTGYRDMHDPCTMIFFNNRHFYVDAKETASPFINRVGKFNEVYKQQFALDALNSDKSPKLPVKVASCFQGATFYRMSSMRAGPVYYRYSEGEWHCEHSTLSMQLRENYLDMQMQRGVIH